MFRNRIFQKTDEQGRNSNAAETIQTFVPGNFTSQPKIIGFVPERKKLVHSQGYL